MPIDGRHVPALGRDVDLLRRLGAVAAGLRPLAMPRYNARPPSCWKRVTVPDLTRELPRCRPGQTPVWGGLTSWRSWTPERRGASCLQGGDLRVECQDPLGILLDHVSHLRHLRAPLRTRLPVLDDVRIHSADKGIFGPVALQSRVSCRSVSALTKKCRNHWFQTSRVRSSNPGQTVWRSAWSVFDTRTRSFTSRRPSPRESLQALISCRHCAASLQHGFGQREMRPQAKQLEPLTSIQSINLGAPGKTWRFQVPSATGE